MSQAGRMLAEREARVLGWSLMARISFVAIAAGLTCLYLLGLIPAGVISETPAEARAKLIIEVFAISVAGWLLWLVRCRKHVRGVGYGAVCLDLLVFALIPVLWTHTIPGMAASPALVFKAELFAIAVLLVVINSLTLYPAYPAAMACGSLVILAVLGALTLGDPSVAFTDSYIDHFSTTAINPGIIFMRVLMLVLTGVFLAAAAYSGRKTIREAVELEVANLDLRERHADMVIEGKMTALNSLVAGMAHELNTPLGAVRSSLDTRDACIDRILPADAANDAANSRVRRVLDDTGKVAREGLDRISKLVGSLRNFVRLDEAEVQKADLRAEVDTVLSLIEPGVMGTVEVERNYQEIPDVECRPRELNQVFLTILENAFEAMEGQGRLRVETAQVNGEVRLTFADSGPGIPPERLHRLFEVGFGTKGNRVGIGLGLPTGRRIVERHGGRLSVESEPGKGASFRIALPIRSKEPS